MSDHEALTEKLDNILATAFGEGKISEEKILALWEKFDAGMTLSQADAFVAALEIAL